MFFDTTKALLNDVHTEAQKRGPVKAFMFTVYCCLFLLGFLSSTYVLGLGLPEPLAWTLWFAGIAPVIFLYGLWEINAVQSNSLLPKVWYIRNKQIWPRQK